MLSAAQPARFTPTRKKPSIWLLLPVLLLVGLSLLPLLYVGTKAWQAGWSEALHLLWRPYVFGLMRNTLLLMVGVTVTCAVVGLSLAWLLERSNLPGRRLWGVILCLPFAVPAFVSSFTWVSLSASFEGLGGAILVMSLSKYPLIFLPVAATLRNLDPSLEESARTLGLNRWGVFFRITLPLIFPAVIAGWMLAFTLSLDDLVIASFATGPLKHSLAAGLEFLYEKQNTLSFSTTGKTVTAANLYNPNANDALPDPYPTGAYTRGSTLTAGAYLFDTIEITPQWQVSGGVRFDRYRTETDSATATQNSTTGAVTALTPYSLSKSDLLTSWKLGALYKPAANGSVYLAYANAQTPPGGANFSLSSSANSTSNPNMDTQDTSNMELGTKWDVLGGKLGLSAALYRTEHKNELAVLDSLSISAAVNQIGRASCRERVSSPV